MGPRSFDRGNGTAPRALERGLKASMGPRSFDRGNVLVLPPTLAVFPQGLQWGRDHSIAEICSSLMTWSWPCKLQWGRDHSIAEIFGLRERQSSADAASMGPRSFDRGNENCAKRVMCHAEASMGPRSFDRGNRISRRGRSSAQPCFNGAAIIRSRKSSVPSMLRA